MTRRRKASRLDQGSPTRAVALEVAGAEDGLQWELIISTHLARLAPRTGKLREAHDRLARCYTRLSEGFDRGPAREAKAALDELAARLDAGAPAA